VLIASCPARQGVLREAHHRQGRRPLVAARSLASPVSEIAAAIARQDEAYLRRLPGIAPEGKNIVAQLSTKVAKFALSSRSGGGGKPPWPRPTWTKMACEAPSSRS